MEDEIDEARKKCMFARDTDRCLEPKLPQFERYADNLGKKNLSVQAEIEKLYQWKAANILKCSAFNSNIVVIKDKALTCLKNAH